MKFELKTFKLSWKYSEKNSRNAWKKNKTTIRIYPHALKKDNWTFFPISQQVKIEWYSFLGHKFEQKRNKSQA